MKNDIEKIHLSSAKLYIEQGQSDAIIMEVAEKLNEIIDYLESPIKNQCQKCYFTFCQCKKEDKYPIRKGHICKCGNTIICDEDRSWGLLK